MDRKLECRGWSHGVPQTGSVKFQFVPLCPGQTLKQPTPPSERGTICKVDISIIVPSYLRDLLRKTLVFEVNLVFPSADINFVVSEDSGHKAQMYTLLVAHTSTGLRFGRDWLYDRKTKDKDPDKIAIEIAQKVVDELDVEWGKGGMADEYLQDQLLIFQTLAIGRSTFPGSSETLSSINDQVSCIDEPFGEGSMHTTTARWVISQMLPQIRWFGDGLVCEGVGWKVHSTYAEGLRVPNVARSEIKQASPPSLTRQSYLSHSNIS